MTGPISGKDEGWGGRSSGRPVRGRTRGAERVCPGMRRACPRVRCNLQKYHASRGKKRSGEVPGTRQTGASGVSSGDWKMGSCSNAGAEAPDAGAGRLSRAAAAQGASAQRISGLPVTRPVTPCRNRSVAQRRPSVTLSLRYVGIRGRMGRPARVRLRARLRVLFLGDAPGLSGPCSSDRPQVTGEACPHGGLLLQSDRSRRDGRAPAGGSAFHYGFCSVSAKRRGGGHDRPGKEGSHYAGRG